MKLIPGFLCLVSISAAAFFACKGRTDSVAKADEEVKINLALGDSILIDGKRVTCGGDGSGAPVICKATIGSQTYNGSSVEGAIQRCMSQTSQENQWQCGIQVTCDQETRKCSSKANERYIGGSVDSAIQRCVRFTGSSNDHWKCASDVECSLDTPLCGSSSGSIEYKGATVDSAIQRCFQFSSAEDHWKCASNVQCSMGVTLCKASASGIEYKGASVDSAIMRCEQFTTDQSNDWQCGQNVSCFGG
ncbi:MAG: hypothetical protein AB7T49_10205 [Oligoflexales bacterium]